MAECASSKEYGHDTVYMGLPVNGQIVNSNASFLFEKYFTSKMIDDPSLEAFKEVFHNVNKSLTISPGCLADLELLYYLLTKVQYPENLLVFQYLDASSKLPNGVLQGKWNWVGDYQECEGIISVENPATKKQFKGQYFTAALYMNGKPVLGPYPLMLGVCLPDSCNEADANEVENSAIYYIKTEMAKTYPIFSNLSLVSVETVADKQKPLDSGAIAMISVTSVLVFIVFISTLVDYFSAIKVPDNKSIIQEDSTTCADTNDRTGLLSGELFTPNIQEGRCEGMKSSILKCCQAFSVISNGKKLFGTTTAIGPLACLNGIRVMSMWWVILGHTYAFIIVFLDNAFYAETFIQRFTFQSIVNGTFSVDSFFFLSGLLVAYLALNEIHEKGKLNWIYFVLHRYWRLTPLYLFVILYFAFLTTFTVSGPLKFFMRQGPYEESFDACKKYWWTNILYINNMYPNYGNLGTTCLGWGWYLANDMQFYLVFGPIFIILFSRFKRLSVVVAVFFILAGVVIRAIFVWYYGLYGINGQPTKHVDDPWAKNGTLYGRPYARWSVYIVGMLTGYVLSVTKNQIRIHRVVALFCWCSAIATGLAVVYGQYYYYHHPNTHMTLTASVFYTSISRTAWALCLSWVVLACVSGNGGPVKEILSWKFWAPLGRLTYSAYLVHPIVMYTFYFNLRETLHASDLLMIYFFLGHLVISYAVAFIVSMLVEAPMIQLEKLLLKPAGNLGAIMTESFSKLKSRYRN